MTTLTDAEREALAQELRWHFAARAEDPTGTYASLGISNAASVVETIIAARETALREEIAAAMSEAFTDRVIWGDGTEFIATEAAAKIARQARP